MIKVSSPQAIGCVYLQIVPAKSTDYYNVNGNLVKSVPNQKENKKLLVLTSAKQEKKVNPVIDAGHVVAVPSDEVISTMERVYALTEQTGNEHGFRVGNNGTVSIIVEGSPTEINHQQWLPAIDDLRNKGDYVSYDVHSHPYGEGKINSISSDTDRENMVGNQACVVLGYEPKLDAKPSGQIVGTPTYSPERQIRFFEAEGDIDDAYQFSRFKSVIRKINKI